MRVDNHIRSRSTGSDSYLGADWTQIQVLTFTELSYEMYIYKNSRQATKDLACLSFFSKDPASKQACLTGRLWQSGADGTQIGYKFLFMACWFRTVQLSLPFGEWLSWTTWVFLMAIGKLRERSRNPLHSQVRSIYIYVNRSLTNTFEGSKQTLWSFIVVTLTNLKFPFKLAKVSIPKV